MLELPAIVSRFVGLQVVLGKRPSHCRIWSRVVGNITPFPLRSCNLLLQEKTVVLLRNGRRLLLIWILRSKIHNFLISNRTLVGHSMCQPRRLHTLIHRHSRVAHCPIRHTKEWRRI